MDHPLEQRGYQQPKEAWPILLSTSVGIIVQSFCVSTIIGHADISSYSDVVPSKLN